MFFIFNVGQEEIIRVERVSQYLASQLQTLLRLTYFDLPENLSNIFMYKMYLKSFLIIGYTFYQRYVTSNYYVNLNKNLIDMFLHKHYK